MTIINPKPEKFMTIINPKPDYEIELAEKAATPLQKIIVTSGLALIPHIGDAILAGMHQWEFKRMAELMGLMREAMSERIEEIGESQLTREWFESDEFRALLFSVLEQFKTTHDEEKIKILGRALVNGGSGRFVGDTRKELFINIVRYLTPEHMEAMLKLRPPTADLHPDLQNEDTKRTWASIGYDLMLRDTLWSLRGVVRAEIGRDQESPCTLLILQPLVAHGLVNERLKMHNWREPSMGPAFSARSESDLRTHLNHYAQTVFEAMQVPPQHYFCLSLLGWDFLEFMGQKLYTDSPLKPNVMETFGSDSVKASDWEVGTIREKR